MFYNSCIVFGKNVYAEESMYVENQIYTVNRISNDNKTVEFKNNLYWKDLTIEENYEDNSFKLISDGKVDYYKITENGDVIKNNTEKVGVIENNKMHSFGEISTFRYGTPAWQDRSTRMSTTEESIRNGALLGILGLIMGGVVNWQAIVAGLVNFVIGLNLNGINHSTMYLDIFAQFSADFNTNTGMYITRYRKKVDVYADHGYTRFMYKSKMEYSEREHSYDDN